MKMIWVTTQFESYHRWKNAPTEVSFLKNEHRHMFHVKLWIEVKHNDREIEFIQLKHELERYIEKVSSDADSGEYSCETYAEMIKGFFEIKYTRRAIKVSVSEDGENGALIE